jgi:hypothetical protein
VLLEAWLELFGDKEKLCVKVAKGLLAHKKKGHWLSTQENCWCLLALEKYFRTLLYNLLCCIDLLCVRKRQFAAS